jgi:proteasome lid subunit RPN8/RPN11
VTTLVLPIRERLRLHDRAYRAQQRDQSEVCGAVVADSNGRCRLVFLPNQSNRPRHFEMRWSDIRGIRCGIDGSSSRLVAVFHSHVVGEAVPSQGDLARPPTSLLSLIYDVCGRSARLWRLTNVKGKQTATEVPLAVESSATVTDPSGR